MNHHHQQAIDILTPIIEAKEAKFKELFQEKERIAAALLYKESQLMEK